MSNPSESQWNRFKAWNLTKQCGTPDMDDAGDRLRFEAFVAGATPEALHDVRKALLAASTHLPLGSNAAALVAASLKEIEGILGYPQVETPPATPARSHRPLDSVSKLHD